MSSRVHPWRLLFVWTCLAATASSQGSPTGFSELVGQKLARLPRGGGNIADHGSNSSGSNHSSSSSSNDNEEHRVEGAIEICRKALIEDPTRMKARWSLALLLPTRKPAPTMADLAEAREHCRAVAEAPSSVGNRWGSKAPVDVRVQAALQEGAACAADAAATASSVASSTAAAAFETRESSFVAVDFVTGGVVPTATATERGSSSGPGSGKRTAEWWYQFALEIAVDAEAGTTALSTITAGAAAYKGSSSSSKSSSSGSMYRGLTGLCLEKLAPLLLVQVHAGSRDAEDVVKVCRLVQKHVPAEPLASFYLGAALRQQALHVPKTNGEDRSSSSSMSSGGLSTSSGFSSTAGIGKSSSSSSGSGSGGNSDNNDQRMRLLRESAEAYIEAATRSEALYRAALLTQDAAVATATESAAAAAAATAITNPKQTTGAASTTAKAGAGEGAAATATAAAAAEYASVSATVATAAVESTAQHLERWLRHSGLAGVALGEANEAASGEILLEVTIKHLTTALEALASSFSPSSSPSSLEKWPPSPSFLALHVQTLEALLVDTWTHLGVLLKDLPDRKADAEKALMHAVELGTSSAGTSAGGAVKGSAFGGGTPGGGGGITTAAKGGAAGQVGHALVQLASLRSSSSSSSPAFGTTTAAATLGTSKGSSSSSDCNTNGLDYSAPLPAEYVESLFDAYSNHFETSLVDTLSYQGHTLVVDAAVKHATAAAVAATAADALPSSSPLSSLLEWKSVTNNEQPQIGKDSRCLFPVVLDLGCGTGLVGRTLRSRSISTGQPQQKSKKAPRQENALVGALVGIDLSARMASKAQETNAYNALLVADILAFLYATIDDASLPISSPSSPSSPSSSSSSSSSFESALVGGPSKEAANLVTVVQAGGGVDLITAADLFIYTGALPPVLVGCYRILKPGGWLVFTVEELVDGVIGAKDDVSKPGDDVISGVRLLPSGRFGHSVQHVKRAAKDSGFSLEACDPVRALRYQNGQPVPGLTVVLRKQLQ